MKRAIFVGCLLALLIPAVPARAEAPGLQVNPLQYDDVLETNKVKLGFIEVSNPSDAAIEVESKVQAFQQEGNDGRLSFRDDPEISKGIKVDLPRFSLGPREAIRVAFNVDPTKLPQGGVYAVIFFRTIPPEQTSGSSYVAESANIGTLLLLQNGGSGEHVGEITKLSLPFFQFGQGIKGAVTYKNTDRTKGAVGFKPALSARVLPWGDAPAVKTGLVLPGVEREFVVERTGAYLGLLPLTVTDTESKKHTTSWVFAVTGWYQLLLLVGLVALLFIRPRSLARAFRRLTHRPEPAPDVDATPPAESESASEAADEPEPKPEPSEPDTETGVDDESESDDKPAPESETQPEPPAEKS